VGRSSIAGAVFLGLAGCTASMISEDAVPETAAPHAASLAPDEKSGLEGEDLSKLYAEVERDLTTHGRMRREIAPSDAPFTVDDLVRNFERIALFDEYVEIGGRFIRSETPALLRRWTRPVRVGVVTGGLPEGDQAAQDRRNVADFTARLAGLTGLDMRVAEPAEVNYLVLILSSAERAAFAQDAARRYSRFEAAMTDSLSDAPVDTFCTAYAFADPLDPSVYAAVVVLIRAEHPPLTRLSCIHEEMAQAMGLPNDSPEARPSLFNDSLEFAFLTDHDEILLRMLYDPRLAPGMTAEEVRPLLPEIAKDAMAEQARARAGRAVQES
jgi:hypothetical protein